MRQEGFYPLPGLCDIQSRPKTLAANYLAKPTGNSAPFFFRWVKIPKKVKKPCSERLQETRFTCSLQKMANRNFQEIVDLILQDDARYAAGAYFFIREALAKTQSDYRRREKLTNQRHITGTELCHGIRKYALDQFGPMAATLLNEWGLSKTRDFGNIVFNLIEFGIFGKTEHDCIEDFDDVFDFEHTFKMPYIPQIYVHSHSSNDLSKTS